MDIERIERIERLHQNAIDNYIKYYDNTYHDEDLCIKIMHSGLAFLSVKIYDSYRKMIYDVTMNDGRIRDFSFLIKNQSFFDTHKEKIKNIYRVRPDIRSIGYSIFSEFVDLKEYCDRIARKYTSKGKYKMNNSKWKRDITVICQIR